jgi:hypothetical protein
MEIRKDLEPVSQYLERLLVYRNTFSEYNKRWGVLKNKEDYSKVYSLNSDDKITLEKIYEVGRDLAIHMSSKLEEFNYADSYPTLTLYIESFAGGGLDEVEVLAEISNKAKQKCKELKNVPWAIEQMIILFDDQIKLLESVTSTLTILKKSDLWRIENGGELMSKERGNIHISNVSGRVNIDSVDTSINESTINIGTTFTQIREVITSSDIDKPEKDSLIEKLSDLEGSVNSSDYSIKYKEFVQLAANHMSIIAPFIPALTNLLKG